ncbi:MAG: hypothetical protein IKY59_07375 [Oscillospiraceae bacterium]|nr:hypothetical protein [Oscillospiraceae bacterium]
MLNKIQNGIARYIDMEILPQVDGWQKWALGVAITLKLSEFPALIENLKKTLPSAFDEHGNPNIEMLYREFAKQADKGSITINVPLLNDSLTLNRSDVDKIYRYITEGINI